MSSRSRSTVDRDHQRAIDHKARLKIQSLEGIDWETVYTSELYELRDELEDLESEVEDEDTADQIRELLDLLAELD